MAQNFLHELHWKVSNFYLLQVISNIFLQYFCFKEWQKAAPGDVQLPV